MATAEEILMDMERDRLEARAKAHRETAERVLKAHLDDRRATGRTRISFCTNPMLSRGTVVHCELQEDGTAMITSEQTWWSMAYSAHTYERKGQTLGKVCADFGYNSKIKSLKCAGLEEGRG